MTSLLLVLLASSAAGLEPGSIITLPPHVGLVLSTRETPGVALFLPWVLSLPRDEAAPLRPSQLVIEVGAVLRAATAFTSRLALRWLRSPLSWLALGGGLGMGVDAAAGLRAVTSAELVARLGQGPHGYALISTRVEVRHDGSAAFMAAVGATYW